MSDLYGYGPCRVVHAVQVYRGLWHGCTCAVKLMLAASTENLSLQLTEVFVCKALSCHPNM